MITQTVITELIKLIFVKMVFEYKKNTDALCGKELLAVEIVVLLVPLPVVDKNQITPSINTVLPIFAGIRIRQVENA